MAAMRALGAVAEPDGETIVMTGTGNGCLLAADALLVLDDPLPAVLLAGLVAPYDMATQIACTAPVPDGDLAALLDGFSAMGIQAVAPDGSTISLQGQASATPARHDGSHWSEAVTGAIALSALNTPGITRLNGAGPPPQDIATMLGRFGVPCELSAAQGIWSMAIAGQGDVRGLGEERLP